jgi:hypothetical protein
MWHSESAWISGDYLGWGTISWPHVVVNMATERNNAMNAFPAFLAMFPPLSSFSGRAGSGRLRTNTETVVQKMGIWPSGL